jgi:hypothetical protein
MRHTSHASLQLSLALALGVGPVAASAHAQAETGRKVAAEALFDGGMERMREGKYAEACPKLEQSQSIEPGIGVTMYLAECYERTGRIASAWALFREAASAAREEGQLERYRKSTDRANALEPTLPRLSIQVAPGDDMAGFAVLLNGVELPSTAWAATLPVDPGDNQLEARAPGYASFIATVAVPLERGTVEVEIPALAPVMPEARPQLAAVGGGADPGAAPRTAALESRPVSAHMLHDGSSERRWQLPLGVATAGLGAVALGVGAYFGVRAITQNHAAAQRCPDKKYCDDALGRQESQAANGAAKRANGFAIGGAVLAGAGLVLWLTAPSERSAAVAVHADGRAVAIDLAGVF